MAEFIDVINNLVFIISNIKLSELSNADIIAMVFSTICVIIGTTS